MSSHLFIIQLGGLGLDHVSLRNSADRDDGPNVCEGVPCRNAGAGLAGRPRRAHAQLVLLELNRNPLALRSHEIGISVPRRLFKKKNAAFGALLMYLFDFNVFTFCHVLDDYFWYFGISLTFLVIFQALDEFQ